MRFLSPFLSFPFLSFLFLSFSFQSSFCSWIRFGLGFGSRLLLQEELHGTGCAERNAIRLIAKRSLLRILPVVAFCRAQLGLLCRQMQVAVSGRKKTRQERATALAQSHPNLTRWAYARMLAVVSYTGSLARLLACCLLLVPCSLSLLGARCLSLLVLARLLAAVAHRGRCRCCLQQIATKCIAGPIAPPGNLAPARQGGRCEERLFGAISY